MTFNEIYVIRLVFNAWTFNFISYLLYSYNKSFKFCCHYLKYKERTHIKKEDTWKIKQIELNYNIEIFFYNKVKNHYDY